MPKPLTTGPFTGQMKPAADGVPDPVDPPACVSRTGRRERGALRGESLDLGEILGASLAGAGERAPLQATCSEERVATGGKLVPHLACLLGTGGDDDGGGGREPSRARRRPSLGGRLQLRRLDLLCDPLCPEPM